MANFKTGVLITGDSSGAVKALTLTRENVDALKTTTQKAARGQQEFQRASDQSRQSILSLGNAAKLASAAIATIGVGNIARDFTRFITQVDGLRGALQTVTGSAESANKAFGELQRFALQTPFTLDQTVGAFVKLRTLGLDASQKSLTAFGNAAAAMNRSMTEMVDAVGRAAYGEMEGLRTYGITAEKTGSQVTLALNGVTRTVEQSKGAIVGALREIIDANFGDAMQLQMERLPGLFSNLDSAVQNLYVTIGDMGATSALGAGLSSITDAINGVNESLLIGTDAFETLADVAIMTASVFVARMAPAMIAYTSATIAATAENIRYQLTLARMAGVSAGAAAGTVAMGAAMGALGGPVGLAIIAATAIYTFGMNSKTAAEQADELAKKVDKVSAAFDQLSRRGQEAARKVLQDLIRETESEIERINQRLARGGTFKYGGGKTGSLKNPRDRVIQDDAEQTLELETALAGLNETLNTSRDRLAAMDAVLAGTRESIDDAADSAASMTDATAGLAGVTGDVAAATGGLATETENLLDKYLPLQKLQRDYIANLAELQVQLAAAGASDAEVAEAIGRLATEYAEAYAAQSLVTRSANDLTDAEQALLDVVFPLRAQNREYAADLALLNIALDKVGATEAERAEAIQALRDKHYELKDGMSDVKDEASDVAKAWEAAGERIDAAFARAWEGAFDGFNSFADDLKGAFKSLMAELAHAAITRPILVSLGLTGQGGIFSAGGIFSGGGGLSSGVSSVGGAYGTVGANGGAYDQVQTAVQGVGLLQTGYRLMTGGLASVGSATNSFFTSPTMYNMIQHLPVGAQNVIGAFANNVVGSAGQFGQAFGFQGNAAVGAGMVANMGAGIVGGYAGNRIGTAITGQTAENPFFTTVGSIVGSNWGPVGTAIGAFLGGVVDTAVGGSPKSTAIGIENGTDMVSNKFRGPQTRASSGLMLQSVNRHLNTAGQRSADSFLEAILAIDEGLTSISRSMGIGINFSNVTLAGRGSVPGNDVGSFFGVKGSEANGLKGTLQDAAVEFIDEWLNEINDELPTRVKQILQASDRVAEVIVARFEAASIIEAMLSIDVVRATEEAAKALGEEQLNMLEQYADLTDRVMTLTAELDGSADSVTELASALSDQKAAALTIATALRELAIASDQLFGNAIQSIRESMMSEEELYAFRRQQINDLTAQLSQTTSPDEIASIINSIDQLAGAAWQMLDDSQRQAMGNEFIGFLTNANELAQAQIEAGLSDLAAREDAVRSAIDLELSASAAVQSQASNNFASAVAQFGEYVAMIQASTTISPGASPYIPWYVPPAYEVNR